jgi:hypothetical protein
MHHVRTTELIRWEDFDFVWDSRNKYDLLGNGVTEEGYAPEDFPWLGGEATITESKAVQRVEVLDEAQDGVAVPIAGTLYWTGRGSLGGLSG